jgi:hypothetical protein
VLFTDLPVDSPDVNMIVIPIDRMTENAMRKVSNRYSPILNLTQLVDRTQNIRNTASPQLPEEL